MRETIPGRIGEAVSRTGVAVRATMTRRGSTLVLVSVAFPYLLAYLFAIGHLGTGSGRVDLLVVDAPFTRLLHRTGPLQFEPIARLDAGPLTYLFAPPNLAIGSVLAALVGLNFALSYLAWRQPAACGLSVGTGPFAALPALLSGAACCGPALLVVLGIQASGLLLSVFGVLVPVAVVLLTASLFAVGRKVDPTVASG